MSQPGRTMQRRLPHFCHAEGCEVKVPPRMLMCLSHWYMLPKAMRDRLWELYEPGQERRMDPSPEYIEHAMACVEYVRVRESLTGWPSS